MKTYRRFALFTLVAGVAACGSTGGYGLGNDAGSGNPPTTPADSGVPPATPDAGTPPAQPDAGNPPAQLDAGNPPAPVDAGNPPVVREDGGITCILDSGGVTGTKRCRDLLTAAQSCQSLATPDAQCRCVNDKFKEGTASAQTYAKAVFECAERSACGTNVSCIMSNCMSQIITCQSN